VTERRRNPGILREAVTDSSHDLDSCHAVATFARSWQATGDVSSIRERNAFTDLATASSCGRCSVGLPDPARRDLERLALSWRLLVVVGRELMMRHSGVT
jgi:hypothetical protein